MDPYFETEMGSGDFRHSFIVHVSERLNEIMPERYVARIHQRRFAVDPDLILPRRLMSSSRFAATSHEGHSRIRNMEFGDPYRELFVKIIQLPVRNVVTVVALLSPANKHGGRGQYLQWRQRLLRRPVNIVEIDLTRDGVRPLFEIEFAAGSYCFLLSPARDRPCTDIHEWTVRDPVPAVPVDLGADDHAVRLELAELIGTVRQRGRYEALIDYTRPPAGPPFADEDARWVERHARAAIAK
jgi:hypothetical protein